MQHFSLRSLSPFKPVHLLRLSVAQGVLAGSVAAALPAAAVTYDSTYRSTSGDCQSCVAEIIGTGIENAEAAAACGAALYPRDLSSCVVGIDSGTAITSTDALSNCRRVRRPTELSTCVVDIGAIDNPSEPAPLLRVLDHCRRSLLPVRFSACVVGLRNQIDYPTETAMTDCISATNRPRSVLPNFLPGNTTSTQPPTVQPPTEQTLPAPAEPQSQSAPEQMQQPMPATQP